MKPKTEVRWFTEDVFRGPDGYLVVSPKLRSEYTPVANVVSRAMNHMELSWSQQLSETVRGTSIVPPHNEADAKRGQSQALARAGDALGAHLVVVFETTDDCGWDTNSRTELVYDGSRWRTRFVSLPDTPCRAPHYRVGAMVLARKATPTLAHSAEPETAVSQR